MSEKILNPEKQQVIQADSPSGHKIGIKTLRQCWIRTFTLDVSWNYERMQGLSFLYAIYPALKKIYKDEDQLQQACQRHLQFFNTNGITGSTAISTAIAAEECLDGDAATSSKISLMGPMAGIGDTLIGALWRPIVGAIAASTLIAGNLSGLFLFLLLPFWSAALRWFLCSKAYQATSQLLGEIGRANTLLPRITDIFSSIGLTVIGGFIPMVLGSVTLKAGYNQTVDGVSEFVSYQTVLDALMPNLLVVAFVGVVYYLLKVKEISAIKAIVIATLFAFATSIAGIL